MKASDSVRSTCYNSGTVEKIQRTYRDIICSYAGDAWEYLGFRACNLQDKHTRPKRPKRAVQKILPSYSKGLYGLFRVHIVMFV